MASCATSRCWGSLVYVVLVAWIVGNLCLGVWGRRLADYNEARQRPLFTDGQWRFLRFAYHYVGWVFAAVGIALLVAQAT